MEDNSVSKYVREHIRSTDRRPKPNAASGSLTSGFSFPSFRYRSGWNSIGSLKTLGSCNMVLNSKFRTERRTNCSY